MKWNDKWKDGDNSEDTHKAPILGREGLMDDTKATPGEVATREYDTSVTPEQILKKYK